MKGKITATNRFPNRDTLEFGFKQPTFWPHIANVTPYSMSPFQRDTLLKPRNRKIVYPVYDPKLGEPYPDWRTYLLW